MIPRIDLAALSAGEAEALEAMRVAATDVGFATIYNAGFSADEMRDVIETYRRFFRLPMDVKAACDMARTGSNRGWGAPASEQVDPQANPDFKEFFDSGLTLPSGDPLLENPFYAANLWPAEPAEFAPRIQSYYREACRVSLEILFGVARALDLSGKVFEGAFDQPMALLRGNFYPERPAGAGAKDFGIAAHTDYGCLTFLATDGAPGLEVRRRGGGWIPLRAAPGTFIINFGEMLEFWSGGLVKATPHRVIGGDHERVSVPLFFNPSHDTNVAPEGSGQRILAGDHLAKRFNETYVHLQTQ